MLGAVLESLIIAWECGESAKIVLRTVYVVCWGGNESVQRVIMGWIAVVARC